MAGIRAGLGVLLAGALLAPSAWACVEPERADEPDRVSGRAGEEVVLAVPNTLEGAEWAIRLADADDDDDPLARGSDEDADQEGVEAEFDVPDLGADERTVELVVEVEHDSDDADWSYPARLDYRGRAAQEAPKEEEQAAPPPRAADTPPPAPERAATAHPQPAAANPPSHAGPAASPPAAPAPAAGHAPVPAPAIPAPTPAFPVEPPGGPAAELVDEITALGAALPAVVRDGPAVRGSAAKASRSRRARRDAARELRSAAPEPRRPAVAEPADGGGIRLPDVNLPGFGSGLAWSMIAAGTLAFALAGLGVGGLARHRRRRIGSPAA